MPITDFNSIKVRLKQRTKTEQHHLRAFQFHKGTIKTLVRITEIVCEYLFQFHKGTIKTVFDFVCTYVDNISIP